MHYTDEDLCPEEYRKKYEYIEIDPKVELIKICVGIAFIIGVTVFVHLL